MNCEIEPPNIEQSEYISRVVKTLEDITTPTLTHANVCRVDKLEENVLISTRWNQKNYKLEKNDSFNILYKYSKTDGSLRKISTPVLSVEVPLLESWSSSLRYRAVVKKHKAESSSKDEYVLEIWSHTGREKVINLSSFNLHGMVHGDNIFGRLVWSSDDTKLLYVAEKRKEEKCGFFEESSNADDGTTTSLSGNKYEYVDNWGEQLQHVSNTVICVMSVADEKVKVLEGISSSLCPFQPCFGPDDAIVFAALQTTPYRHGLIYCRNRQSGIYSIKSDDKTSLVDISQSVGASADYNPQINGDRSKMVFVRYTLSGKGDPHTSNNLLMIHDFASSTTSLLQDFIVYNGEKFPLYTKDDASYNIWLPDDKRIAIMTYVEGIKKVCIIDTTNGRINSLIDCTSLFGVHDDLVLTSNHKLSAAHPTFTLIDCKGVDPKIVQEELDDDREFETGKIIDEHGLVSHFVLPNHEDDPSKNDRNRSYPLIVQPHGGPHSMFTDDYQQNVRLFSSLGYAVLLVNYRGSIGFSKTSLTSLLGRVGDQDVKDVHNVVNKFLRMYKGSVDKRNIFAIGGSHGGFIVAHLIGQFPQFYRAACLRNPGVEIFSKMVCSDIPDWGYVETGLEYDPSAVPTEDEVSSMVSKSPMQYAKYVTAPVLLCIGGMGLESKIKLLVE